MGGGNAQKSATARARNLAKAEGSKNCGGGKDGMAARKGGDMESGYYCYLFTSSYL
jgi:hypothetical protein